jgi:glycosyltransferase involved in cell wall biosynthesis
MYCGKKVVVVMPAYNAAKTIERAFAEVCEQNIADIVVVVDDCSRDETVDVARGLSYPGVDVVVHRHNKNLGYGGNQKSCYRIALEKCSGGQGIVVMVHPDCQYTPKLLTAMVSMISAGLHDCVLASRILGGYALKGGMPLWKYVANRALTFFMNFLMGAKLSEYHTGYRAFSTELLSKLPLDKHMDDFAFDAQMLAEIIWTGTTIGEVSCPTVYFDEASSINFRRSCKYGFGCLGVSMLFRLCRMCICRSGKFPV